jgi:hypothetical protein
LIQAEPHDLRMLVVDRGAIVTEGKQLVGGGAADGSYSPDGTLLAFARDGDLWLANADGTGQRRLVQTPNVAEWKPSWLPDGKSIVYSAEVDGARQIRVVALPGGPSKKVADGSGAAVSPSGRVAYVADQAIVVDGRPFDVTPQPYNAITGLAWSPDGTKLAYSADGAIVIDDGTTQVVGPAGTNPVWSPNGNRIAFSDGGQLASIAADATDLRTLGPGVPTDWQVVPVGVTVFPNLVQRPPSQLTITRARNGHWLLGYMSMVDNRGPGVLWIKARRRPGKRIMDVRQYVQLRDGSARVDPPAGELHYVVAPPHYHWHMLGFVHAELRAAGSFALRLRDHKSGFCIADHYGGAIGIRHGPPRFLGNCEQYDPKARFVEEGSSVGYTDRYPAFFHGQQLDIDGVPAGRYWLVHRANEGSFLREARYDDNAASVLIRLRWRGGAPSVTTLRVCSKERC